MQYRVCPDCGAHLDHGEHCDCEANRESRPVAAGAALREDTANQIQSPFYYPTSASQKCQALLPPAYRPLEAAEAQARFCRHNGYLMYAPGSGYCFKCGRNIYKPYISATGVEVPGYTVEQAGRGLITGCPFCHATYID